MVKYYPVFFRLVYNDGTSKTYVLDDEPIGWDKVDLILKRDVEYWGVNYQYSDGDINLEFSPGYGSEIIKELYDTYGPDYTITFQYGYTINTTEYVEFEGRLNLNTYKYNHKNCVSCTIETSGIHAILNTRKDTPINIFDNISLDFTELPALSPVDVELHSKGIRKVFRTNKNETETSIIEEAYGLATSFYWTFNTQENLISEITEFQGTINKTWDEPPYQGPNRLPVWEAVESGKYKFNIQTTFIPRGLLSSGILGNGIIVLESTYLYLRVEDKNNNYVNQIALFSDVNRANGSVYVGVGSTIIPGVGYRHVVNNEIEIDVNQDDKIYLFGRISITTAGDRAALTRRILVDSFKLDVVANTQLEPSTSKGFFIHEALSRIINSITTQNAFYSDYFGRESIGYGIDGEGSKFIILNGFLIRRFLTETFEPLRNLSVSFKQLISSLKSIFGIGVGYEYINGNMIVRVEKDEYFFQPVEILLINDNSEYTEETAIEFIPNEIKVGYSKYPDEGDYMLDEFNTEHTYSTPIKTNKKTYEFKSELLASGYAIETTRRLQFEKEPVDSSTYDDANFIVAVRFDGGWKSEKNEAFSSTTNIYSPETAYNLRISPKRNLFRHSKIINGGLTWQANSDGIKNVFYKNNGDAGSQLIGEPYQIIEKSDIILSDFSGRDRFFKAIWIRFKCRLSPEDVQQIKAAHNGMDLSKKNGYISTYNLKGEIVSGYIFDLAYNPATEQATFKLLKADIQSGGTTLNCSDFADYTSKDFETKPLPSWIEDCTFANFN